MSYFGTLYLVSGDSSYLLGGVFALIIVAVFMSLANSHTHTEYDEQGNPHSVTDGTGKLIVWVMFLLFAGMCLLPVYGYFIRK